MGCLVLQVMVAVSKRPHWPAAVAVNDEEGVLVVVISIDGRVAVRADLHAL